MSLLCFYTLCVTLFRNISYNFKHIRPKTPKQINKKFKNLSDCFLVVRVDRGFGFDGNNVQARNQKVAWKGLNPLKINLARVRLS